MHVYRHRYSRVLPWLMALCAAMEFLAGPLHAVEPRPNSLDEVVSKLHQWRAAFTSIRIVARNWRETAVAPTNHTTNTESQAYPSVHEDYEFLWSEWVGAREESTSYSDERPTRRQARAVRANLTWNATTDCEDGSDEWTQLNLDLTEPFLSHGTGYVMSGCYGLWNVSGLWLNDRLEWMDDVTFAGYEDLNGQECALVKIQAPDHEELLWLDVQCGFVPRQHQYWRVGGNFPGQPPRKLLSTWVVKEFQNLGPIWFPLHGQFLIEQEPPPGMQWAIDSVSLNVPLLPEAFAPPEPGPNTRVHRDSRLPPAADRSNASQPGDENPKGLTPESLVLLSFSVLLVTCIAIAVYQRIGR